jgi:hypothetical protein
MNNRSILLALVFGVASDGNALSAQPGAQLWQPDLVSTPQAEVRITFSPDGQRMLWGTIDWPNGRGGWDIYESHRVATGWSKPQSVSFNSSANDFDPSFATDGSGVFFFSNRDGGFGKDDLYFARFDSMSNEYAQPENLGPDVNTAGEEWAPVMSRDGQRLMFASDGHGGSGRHDLFVAHKSEGKWERVTNLSALNSAEEDFDAAFLDDDQSIVFSRGDFDSDVSLFVAQFRDGKLSPPRRLPSIFNSEEPGAWTFGPSISLSEPRVLYFTSHHKESRGRADIYRVELSSDLTR